MTTVPNLGRVVAVLAMGLLVCGFAESVPDAGADDGTPVAIDTAAGPSASDTPLPATDAAPPVETPEDVIRSASVVSPYRISEKAAQGKIRYRIAMRDGGPWPWPETGEQHVRQDGDAVVLTICRTCGREAPPDAAELQRDLAPNHWADNRDPYILMLADDVRGATVDSRMRTLAHEVRLQINGPIDWSKYLTSREAFLARSGDCTEFALLLAAGAKARHVPVRVVFGMAYASRFLGRKRVFGPHMWVQAWDGKRWTSYDAGLGDFDSTHIALAVGDGSPEELAAAFARLKDVRIVRAESVLPAVAAGR